MSGAAARQFPPQADAIKARLAALDHAALSAELDAQGYAVLPSLLDAAACRALAMLYEEEARFRSRVVMARHGYGQGEYKYFAYPLPDLVARLRDALYEQLAPIANRWNDALRLAPRYPAA